MKEHADWYEIWINKTDFSDNPVTFMLVILSLKKFVHKEVKFDQNEQYNILGRRNNDERSILRNIELQENKANLLFKVPWKPEDELILYASSSLKIICFIIQKENV